MATPDECRHSSGVATGIDFGYFENVGKIKRRFFEYKNEANKSGIDMEDVIPDDPRQAYPLPCRVGAIHT